MKDLRKDVRGEWHWSDIIVSIFLGSLLIGAAVCMLLFVEAETQPLEIRVTNTSAEPLPVEIYVNGIFYLADTIDSKTSETYEYKNGFWGPGNTVVVIKLPNTLFEKEGSASETVSFVFE